MRYQRDTSNMYHCYITAWNSFITFKTLNTTYLILKHDSIICFNYYTCTGITIYRKSWS